VEIPQIKFHTFPNCVAMSFRQCFNSHTVKLKVKLQLACLIGTELYDINVSTGTKT